MGHRRISNKKMKQMLQEVLPDDIQNGKDDSLVEGKESKPSKQSGLPLDDQQK
ncbi:hypothetical protein [Enterovibrio nigricans]|uniref:Uncharacterized protein n=1 Tax=Enterovibrio nigricans DSM 22720 TaxID=1121868 RepID=A0A1T4U697_9GAMM|nr:hypothetical protein [Enterovibrio nigricans]SKA48119.1 hypothetical protein SAMN02745132_00855 [Enterovibrio nigricans DSM 22720]